MFQKTELSPPTETAPNLKAAEGEEWRVRDGARCRPQLQRKVKVRLESNRDVVTMQITEAVLGCVTSQY